MLLASILRDWKAELRADFQQYYCLNLDEMGHAYTLIHAASLTAMLPATSRTFIAINPENAFTVQDHLLALIEYWCHLSVWMNSDDGRKKRNRPKLLLAPEAKKESRLADGVVLDSDAYLEILSKPRKEVTRGN